MQVLHESPVLQSQTRTGKAKFWRAAVLTNGVDVFYQKAWWQEGSKIQTSTPVQVEGKNIGRSNETTPEDQAVAEFNSIVQKQRDKGYSEDGSSDHIPTKPMLANKYRERAHKVVWPCFAQTKLDGFRMLKEGDGKAAWTRGGKPHVMECVQHLMWDTGNVMVDGELILPHMPPLQETARAAKKYRPGVSDKLIYAVYDVVEPDMPFAERYELLEKVMKNSPPNVRLVLTVEIANEEELRQRHGEFVQSGYEGAIVRSGQDGYNVGHRSNSLLKFKDFKDAEFKIIGAKDGKGSFKGKVIFICETHDGLNEFDCVPEGPMSYRAELYEDRADYIGRYLTVRYAYLSEENKPIFPIGIDFRNEGEF